MLVRKENKILVINKNRNYVSEKVNVDKQYLTKLCDLYFNNEKSKESLQYQLEKDGSSYYQVEAKVENDNTIKVTLKSSYGEFDNSPYTITVSTDENGLVCKMNDKYYKEGDKYSGDIYQTNLFRKIVNKISNDVFKYENEEDF